MYRNNLLKRKLAAGESTSGIWVTLADASVAEIAVELALDWIVIDAEHGHLDFGDVANHLRAVKNTPVTALVRIQEIEQGLIKRMLDIGAEGLLIPQIETAADVAQAVKFAKYPPQGVRGVGVERSTKWGLDLLGGTARANDETLIIPFIETVAAADCVDEILAVPGIDALFFGPADFSASSGFLGKWTEPAVMARMLQVQARVRAQKIPCGIFTTSPQDARLRREQGFQMVGLGTDAGMLIRGIQQAQQALGQ